MRLQLSATRLFPALAVAARFLMAWSAPTPTSHADITLPDPQPYPSVACTAQELTRLREAYRGGGREREPVARQVAQANQALKEDVIFPPEGGQHNQWSQTIGKDGAQQNTRMGRAN